MSIDRGFIWMDEETIALIDIYSKEEIQQELSSCKRNISVYERIAAELLDMGYRRTAYQCREKIKRLRKEYHLAKYCIEHDITNKKPMKHFDLVDRIFNRDISEPNNAIDFGLLSSDLEDELHFSFTNDHESDASNSCSGIESVIPQVILPGPSCSPIQDNESSSITSIINSQNSPSNTHTDSNDAFLLNGEHTYDCSGKASPLDDSESPWVPNVVLVENDLGNSDLGNCSENTEVLNDILHENGSLNNFQNTNSEVAFEDSQEPPEKRRRYELTENWFSKMIETVTDIFLKHHETTESRFLERVSHLEQERMKRDEKLQKLWMEFEERRRKEEQQHELRMMSLLGQFICQISQNDSGSSQ